MPRHHAVILTLLLLIPATAIADPSASVLQLESTYPSCQPNGCTLATDQGSAVVIGERDGHPVAVTCWHCVRHHLTAGDAGRLRIRIRQQLHTARVLATWQESDLALVSIDTTPLDPVEILESPQPAAQVELIGYPAGRFTRLKAKIKARSSRGELITNQPVQHGQSGGGLFSGDALAGVVWGTSQYDSIATSGSCVRQFATHYKVKLKLRSAPAPPIESIGSPRPGTPGRGAGGEGPGDTLDPQLATQLQIISDRLKQIEAKAGVPGPMGPAGPIGPAGPAGPPGNNADTAQLSALAKRLTALESRGVTVQLIDETGAVISEQTYAPGKPIRLQFNPVK